MSNVPPDKGELVVHKTELEPIDPGDSRSAWLKFVDGLRHTIGLKPLYLAERWTEAKVRQEEADADTRLLAAKAEYELAMAQARSLELAAQGKLARDVAEAGLLRAQANAIDMASNNVVAELMQSASADPSEALENLKSVIEQIKMLGGNVGIDLLDVQDKDEEKS